MLRLTHHCQERSHLRYVYDAPICTLCILRTYDGIEKLISSFWLKCHNVPSSVSCTCAFRFPADRNMVNGCSPNCTNVPLAKKPLHVRFLCVGKWSVTRTGLKTDFPPPPSSQEPQCCGTSGWQQRGRIRERCRNAVKPPWRILGTSPPLPLLWAQSVGSFKEHYLRPSLLPYTPLLLSAPTICIRGLKRNRQTALSSALFRSFCIWLLFRAIDIIRRTRP